MKIASNKGRRKLSSKNNGCHGYLISPEQKEPVFI